MPYVMSLISYRKDYHLVPRITVFCIAPSTDITCEIFSHYICTLSIPDNAASSEETRSICLIFCYTKTNFTINDNDADTSPHTA